MADLGKTTNGTGSYNTTGNWFASQYTAPASGQGETIKARLYWATSSSAQVILCVWADNGSDYPGTLLASSSAFSPSSSSETEESQSVVSFTITSGTKYWLGGLSNTTTATMISRDDSGGLNYIKATGGSFTAGNFPASGTSGVRAYDIYVPIVSSATPIPVFMNQYRRRRQ